MGPINRLVNFEKQQNLTNPTKEQLEWHMGIQIDKQSQDQYLLRGFNKTEVLVTLTNGNISVVCYYSRYLWYF